MNVEQRQAADDPQTKPPDSGCEFACRLYAASIYNDDRHLLLLLSPKADLPSRGRRVEGWVDQAYRGSDTSTFLCGGYIYIRL